MNACPVCGSETEQRVGVVIGCAWHYCWLWDKLGRHLPFWMEY